MQPRTPFAVGVDGIEVSPDGKKVFYSPLGSRHLYSVSADALSNPNTPDSQVAATVVDLGDKGASDGFIMASDGQLYVTEYENDAILRRNLDGTFEPVVADPRLHLARLDVHRPRRLRLRHRQPARSPGRLPGRQRSAAEALSPLAHEDRSRSIRKAR